MPKIGNYKYLIFFIVSHDLKERLHIHVMKTKSMRSKAAKIWIDPVEVFEKGDLTGIEINIVVKLIEKNNEQIKEKIINFAKGKKSKPIQLKLK